jgi:hypothetical protein
MQVPQFIAMMRAVDAYNAGDVTTADLAAEFGKVRRRAAIAGCRGYTRSYSCVRVPVYLRARAHVRCTECVPACVNAAWIVELSCVRVCVRACVCTWTWPLRQLLHDAGVGFSSALLCVARLVELCRIGCADADDRGLTGH